MCIFFWMCRRRSELSGILFPRHTVRTKTTGSEFARCSDDRARSRATVREWRAHERGRVPKRRCIWAFDRFSAFDPDFERLPDLRARRRRRGHTRLDETDEMTRSDMGVGDFFRKKSGKHHMDCLL